MKTHSGSTLPEVLVAAVLLSMISLLVVQALVAGFHHSGKLDERHDRLQSFIVFREFFYQNLSQSMIDLSASNSSRVTYFLPHQRSTRLGLVNEVSPGESTHWNQAVRNRITYELRGTEGMLVHSQVVGGVVESERILWNLGEFEPEAVFEFNDSAVIKLTARAREGPGLPLWERNLVVAARTFRT